ncbi:MAG: transcriptional repressor LexA, partial [Anaerolineales bacterium]|nr:transcriptional repressor LexA [Anaerolineales bacterium]
MTKKTKPLSDRQKSILQYIHEYIGENTRPPTIREIGTATHISSTSVVNYNLTRLMERGLVEREPEVSRGLRLTEKAAEHLNVVTEAVAGMVNGAMDAVARLVKVPLLGNIVAGEPIEVGNNDFATYDEDDALEVSISMLPPTGVDKLFALRVSGDSMIDAMVNDNDIVIMQQQETARNGDMVAVWLNSSDTTTLKHFYHEGDRVRL